MIRSIIICSLLLICRQLLAQPDSSRLHSAISNYEKGIGRIFMANTERKNHLEGTLNKDLIDLKDAVWKLLEE